MTSSTVIAGRVSQLSPTRPAKHGGGVSDDRRSLRRGASRGSPPRWRPRRSAIDPNLRPEPPDRIVDGLAADAPRAAAARHRALVARGHSGVRLADDAPLVLGRERSPHRPLEGRGRRRGGARACRLPDRGGGALARRGGAVLLRHVQHRDRAPARLDGNFDRSRCLSHVATEGFVRPLGSDRRSFFIRERIAQALDWLSRGPGRREPLVDPP